MERLISKLNKNTKIIIKDEEYIVKTKTWYSIEEDEEASYIQCELSNDKVSNKKLELFETGTLLNTSIDYNEEKSQLISIDSTNVEIDLNGFGLKEVKLER